MVENDKPLAGANPQGPGHEESDVNVIAVGKVGVGLLLTTIVAMAMIVGVFDYLKSMSGGEAKSVDPVKLFPQPRLEKTEPLNLEQMREAEDEALKGYTWVDRQKGIVRIPIDQAIDQVLKKGLPVRAAAPPVEQGVSVPTESGLGPKMLPPGGPLGVSK